MFSPLNLETGGDGRHPMTLYDQQQIVLAGMICGGEKALAAGMEVLSSDDFTTEHTKRLFETIRTLYTNGDPVSPISVSPQISEDDRTWYLMLLEEWFLTDDIGYYVRLLRQSSQLNRLNRTAYELAYCDDLDEAARLVSKINELSSARRGVKIVSLGDAVQAYVDTIGKQKPEFIRMGLRIFDDEILLRKGRYFVIGGYPSSGKTLLTLQMAQRVAHSKKVGYFSFETDDWDIAVRALSAATGVYNKRVSQQDLNAADEAAIRGAVEPMKALKLELIPATGMTADDIRAITLSRKYDVIFIDYLQSVESTNPRATGYEKVSHTSRTLQGLSRGGNVLVVALSQLSRPEPRKDGKIVPPNMSSLRESGQIEQDADVIALLYPEDMDDNSSNRIFKVAKNKDGEKLTLDLAFAGATQRLDVLGRRRKDAAPAKKQVRASDGSGFMLLPEGQGPEPPQDFKQTKLAF